MRGAYDPRIDRNGFAPSDPLDRAFLEETQQFDL